MSGIFDTDVENAWCPGCGNFPILNAVKKALERTGKAKHEIVLVSGIGQAAKLPHHVDVNVFNGLHGRALPAALAIRMADPSLTVVVTSGDGDLYGEGGNHFLHNIRRNPDYGEGGNHFLHDIRRNPDIAVFVHDNQVYGLTKGQPSPTSDPGWTGSLQRAGVISGPFPPLAVAIALGCGFVARGYAADVDFTADLMVRAIAHKGFALVDILQPCVTFNKKNTYEWYGKMVYKISADHDVTDRKRAFDLSLEWEERIPIGVLYRREDRPTFEELHPGVGDSPLHERGTSPEDVRDLLRKRLFTLP
ncbi:MAG: pyruvate ferredoxin/flavodoxin oxidoreductase, beta subunit [Deltaproteobacteria bacterium]|nr:pyruvate ferredoxin/flavodoxin oxidoreductase, beta subunit [Deltaproteobacteria bacterium]